MTQKRVKILIGLNATWNLFNFRSGLIRALVNEGHEVVAAAPVDNYVDRVVELGCRYVPLEMDNKGTHPGRDLLLFLRFYKLLRNEQPDVYLGYTVKPNIYGSLAAHALRIPVINNIAGLGAVFINEGWLSRLVRGLYRLALSRSKKVFFQNLDDQALFVEGKLVRPEICDRVPGSGVDLTKFAPPIVLGAHEARPTRFLLIARMLWDKGVGQFVEAARVLKSKYSSIDFCLLGFLDVQNPTSIAREQMDKWVAEGVVSYIGVSDNVAIEIDRADCVVLPSYYREGVPRTLLEAAAMGRPIITTDAVGCREVVDEGINGFLCKPRDVGSLVLAMERVLSLSYEQRVEMGKQGRKKVEREFDEKIVIKKYLEVIAEIT